MFSLSTKTVIGSFPTGFDIQRIAVSNHFVYTATKVGIIEVWLKETVRKVASIKVAGGGHAKITSLTSDINELMLPLMAGSRLEHKIINQQNNVRLRFLWLTLISTLNCGCRFGL